MVSPIQQSTCSVWQEMLPKKTCGSQTQSLKYTFSSRREGRVEGYKGRMFWCIWASGTYLQKYIISVFQVLTARQLWWLLTGHLTRYFSRHFEYKQEASNHLWIFKYVSVYEEGFFSMRNHFWCETVLPSKSQNNSAKCVCPPVWGMPKVIDRDSNCSQSSSQALKSSLGSPPSWTEETSCIFGSDTFLSVFKYF